MRDYLETLDWDKKAPGPELPPEIVDKTAAKYAEAWRRLTDEVVGRRGRVEATDRGTGPARGEERLP